jgi:hypothetical protein
VVLVNTDSRELKRTAHRLHIPVERLKNARQALQEATAIAGRARPIEQHHFYQIGELWIQFHRGKAEATIRSIFSELRSAALEADSPEYAIATNAAQGLLSSLARLDPELPLQLASTWPQPPASTARDEQNQISLEQQVRRNTLHQLVHSNPQAALNLLSSEAESGQDACALRGSIAVQMIDAGRTEEGMKLLDQALQDLTAADAIPARNWGYFSNFLQEVSRVAPDRFLEAYRILAHSPALPPASHDHGLTMTIAGGQIALDPNESIAFNALQGISQRPELMMKALDTMPGLKSKMEQAGGIDKALHGESGFRYQPSDGSATTPESAHQANPVKLYAELRGKALKNAPLVRSRLNNEISKTRDAEWLLHLAQMSNWEDPDLAGIALDVARPLIARIEPMQRRVSMLQSLIQTTRQCEGEVDPGLIKEGFVLADELRRSEEDGSIGSRVPADYFEAFLISELSRDDFDSAIKYVRSMPDESMQLTALLQIIQACANPY